MPIRHAIAPWAARLLGFAILLTCALPGHAQEPTPAVPGGIPQAPTTAGPEEIQQEAPPAESGGVPQGPKLGDVSDGNRSVPVHVIELLDEDGFRIDPLSSNPLPFSPRQTCQPCHDYDAVARGWHFNAADPEVDAGRRGEPWVLVDRVTATQVPLSYRDWPGTARPETFGLSPFFFTERFGRHLNGGLGETDAEASVAQEPLDVYWRWLVSGRAEINCLSCHDLEARHDQSQYEQQMRQQNYRWAAAATSAFATVTGSAKGMPNNYDIYTGNAPDLGGILPPRVEYDESRFNDNATVFIDLSRRVPVQRCYFCHSAKPVAEAPAERWELDEDVHLAAGLSCVDCHRNGLDHQMIRGYEGEDADRTGASVASFSCAGCHVRDDASDDPTSGRLGAPNPAHKGLPPIHFDKLTCTACHSGPIPSLQAQRVKLSRTHALGTFGVQKGDDVVPYIMSPVFVRGDDGKTAPHRLMWPAYWGFLRGEEIEAAPLADVQSVALETILDGATAESPDVISVAAGDWPRFSEAQMVRVLEGLAARHPDRGMPVYIGGGKLFRLESSGEPGADSEITVEEGREAARPYTWPLAHDVRPAEQSLGVRGCDDCHSSGTPFVFGSVTAPLPLEFARGSTLQMTTLQGMDAVYPRAFALSFLFRPLFKYVITICFVALSLVLLLYALKGLDATLKAWSAHGS